ncbi:MAG: hypothetical protein MK088_05345 [Alteromonas sp.]|nr:hypothetical protein [Alteromonas sp.]
MLDNVRYQFLDADQPEKIISEHEDLLIENAKQLAVTDEKLVLDGTVLKFWAVIKGAKANQSVKQEDSVDLRNIWVPGAAGWQHPVPILLLPHYAKVLIEIVDIYANNAKHTPTFVKTGLMSQLIIAAQFIEYMCLNGHLRLQSIPRTQISELQHSLKHGGIPTSLRLHERVNAFIDRLIRDDGLEPFLGCSQSKTKRAISSLRVGLIAKHIGSVSLENQIPRSVYKKVADHLKSKGQKVSKHFESKGAPSPSQPSSKSLINWFGTWNRFAKLDSQDQMQFIPFPNPYKLSKEIGKMPGRTKNLDVTEVIALMGGSHNWIFEYAPIVISIVKDLTREKNIRLEDGLQARYILQYKLTEYLSKSSKVKKLEKLTGIEIHKTSLTSSHLSKTKLSITEICTLLMSACYIVLQTYNARRQAEIQDPLTGISEEHFRCANKKLDWYQANFYNEKNGNRRWYTLNKGSTKAIQCLIALKKAWQANENVEGLFNVPSFSINADGDFGYYKYNFNKGKDSKITGRAFLQLMLGDQPDTKSHPFRRIYAVIYHYQYKNADLLALCHQLGHIDPDHTMVYVTEPQARDVHEQLHHKVKFTKDEAAESTIAIKEENKALDKIIEEVGVEATAKDIASLLMGSEEMAGKYPAYLKKVYRILQRSVKFNNLTNDRFGKDFKDLSVDEKSNAMAQVLDSRGHKHKPKAHATCHRKQGDSNGNEAPCEPTKCSGCPYQEVKRTQLTIMKEDLGILQKKQSDFSLLPIERLRAKSDVSNLSILIEHHERTMERSKTLFAEGDQR